MNHVVISRSFAVAVIVAGVGAWGSTKIGLAPGAFTEPASEVRADNTLSSVEFGPGAANEKDGQVDPEAVDLKSEVALLRSDLAEVQRQLRQLAQSVSQAQVWAKASGAEQPADAVVLSEQGLREQEADAIERRTNVAWRAWAGEAALQQESADGAWSIQAAEVLREALASEALSATTIQDIDCRSTLCRVEIVHDNREQQALFEHDFRFKVGQLLPRMMMHSEEQTNATISATMYLAREGHDLPQPED